MTGFPHIPPTPELDKRSEIVGISQEIGEFIEWLGTQGMAICAVKPVGGYPEEQHTPIMDSTEQLLARYFEIDLTQVEAERRAILDALWKEQST